MSDYFIQISVTVVGFLMSIGYFPQAIRIYRKKSAEDISLSTFSVLSIGTLTWLLYGFYLHDWPIILSFMLGVIGSWSVLILSIYYKKQAKSKSNEQDRFNANN